MTTCNGENEKLGLGLLVLKAPLKNFESYNNNIKMMKSRSPIKYMKNLSNNFKQIN